MLPVEPYYRYDLWALGALPLGVALDLLVGYPKGWPDPVRGISWLIRTAERGLRIAAARAGGTPRAERLAGLVLTTVVVGLVASLALLLTDLCNQLGGPATLIGRGLMIYWALSIRSLWKESLRVSEASSLLVARRELSTFVGRDTAGLDATGINRACLETIAEKTIDAVVAPLFWLALLGPAGMWGYKAINTLGNVVGQKNIKYLNFGRASAKLDFLATLIPARLTWLLIALSSALLKEDGLAALKIGRRDGRKHPVRNAAWGEAALAGGLGVQLGGVPSVKPLLGDSIEPIDRTTVRRGVRIMIFTALHAAFLSLAASVLLF